tara:strand:- start:62 stop:832 length:771 start_codon:yes stop_codon:yes gene_type:complete
MELHTACVAQREGEHPLHAKEAVNAQTNGSLQLVVEVVHRRWRTVVVEVASHTWVVVAVAAAAVVAAVVAVVVVVVVVVAAAGVVCAEEVVGLVVVVVVPVLVAAAVAYIVLVAARPVVPDLVVVVPTVAAIVVGVLVVEKLNVVLAVEVEIIQSPMHLLIVVAVVLVRVETVNFESNCFSNCLLNCFLNWWSNCFSNSVSNCSGNDWLDRCPNPSKVLPPSTCWNHCCGGDCFVVVVVAVMIWSPKKTFETTTGA